MAEPSYFDRWFDAIVLRDLGGEGVGFRPAQLGAFWAVCSHFTLNDEAAIVSMPTGSGKTAVMNITPFGLHAKRVLVITPSVLVRDQVAEQFSDFALLRTIEAVKPGTITPKVMRATKQLASKGSWEQCLEYDVVVGTPNCVSPAYQDVGKAFRRVKKDIFDLILIDEGHHAPARTWRILIESFPNARKVLFTATPFRRDKLEIPGSLVYSYSLAKALKDGVYCPIEFVGVSLPDPKHKHQLLIEEAKRVVKNERKAGRDSKLVIRTDHIRSAERLERLYKRNSLTIGLVHSNRSLGHNREVIWQLRAGDLDGIICIGMLGEGFDLPELKIAVYHELECSPMVRVGLHQASASGICRL